MQVKNSLTIKAIKDVFWFFLFVHIPYLHKGVFSGIANRQYSLKNEIARG